MKEPNYTQEYEDWFTSQEEENQIVITAKVKVLMEFGSSLGRPHADTIKGSKYKKLKELRFTNKKHLFRILYIFDEIRECWLLIGGNKKGKNADTFYQNLIKQAEKIIENNPKIMEGKKR